MISLALVIFIASAVFFWNGLMEEKIDGVHFRKIHKCLSVGLFLLSLWIIQSKL